MKKNPELSLINTNPIVNLPAVSAEHFKTWVLTDGLKPSEALRMMMKENDLSVIDSSVLIQLLEITYPQVDVARQGFRFRVIDSSYPNCDSAQFSDADFDAGITELLSLPPEVW